VGCSKEHVAEEKPPVTSGDIEDDVLDAVFEMSHNSTRCIAKHLGINQSSLLLKW
jgi:hypothetical protein